MEINKKLFINIIFFLILTSKVFIVKGEVSSTKRDSIVLEDSIKVFVVGKFYKGESFKIYLDDRILYKKFKNNSNNTLIFYVKIPIDIKKFEQIKLSIYRRGRFEFFYKDTQLDCFYEPDKKYYLIYRDFKLKKRYSFTQIWTNDPLKYFDSNIFFNDEYHYKYAPDKIIFWNNGKWEE